MENTHSHTSSLSRRSFLALSGGVVLLAACGGDDSDTSTPAPTDIEFTQVSAGIVSSDLYVSNEPQRLAFAVLAKEGFASGRPASIRHAPQGTELGEFVEARMRAEGLPEGRAIYTTSPVLDAAGIWEGELDYDGEVSEFAFNVNPQPIVVIPGSPAIAVPSATVGDPLGVDPLCTLDPPCPFHEKSLDVVVGAGKPVFVQFSTPARCQTQYCGPVLEQLVAVGPEFADALEIVHVEIYKDQRTPDLAGAVEAWALPSEPWIFGIDAQGTVTHRADGAFDTSETREILEALASA